MFMVRLSPTFSTEDCCYDLDLPHAPAVGDTIEIDEGAGLPTTFRVKARRFMVQFRNGDQIEPNRPQVLVHVETL